MDKLMKEFLEHKEKNPEQYAAAKVQNDALEDLYKFMRTPRDISAMPIEEQAGIITLSFIGYVARPVGISKELLAKCAEAFDVHRGKVEWEEAAVLEVLKAAQGGTR